MTGDSNTTEIERRRVLRAGLGLAAGVALPGLLDPGRVYAQGYDIGLQHRRVLAVAQAQVQRTGAWLWRRDIVGIADFSLPSSLPRLHFADLEAGRVRSFLVAHGKGSDPDHNGFLKSFSNEIGSLATSRGAYLTCGWYEGKYGTSVRLRGLDADNSNAVERDIVMHPAWYADPAMLGKWGKLGRSDGCFAMSEADFNEALWHLSAGRLLYADRLSLG